MLKLNFIDLKEQQRVIKDDLEIRINKVLEHGQYIMGPEVNELEQKLAKRANVDQCIAVGSGTDALIISLMALDIGMGDEVVVPAFTFAATIEAVLLVGATPVLADIELNTCNIDLKSVEAKITNKTKAIIPVSLFGQMADIIGIMDISRKHGNITIIEDAAQSFGATQHNNTSCGISHIACTSFFPSKPLGCYGDGGAVFTNDQKLSDRMRRIKNHGQQGRYNHVELGTLSRLDTLQAAILMAKLEVFDDEVLKRSRLSQIYESRLDALGFNYVTTKDGFTNLRAQFTVLIPKNDNREKIIKYLNLNSIPTAIHYPKALHQYSPYIQFSSDDLSNSVMAASQVLSLPFHPYLTEQEISHIFATLSGYNPNAT